MAWRVEHFGRNATLKLNRISTCTAVQVSSSENNLIPDKENNGENGKAYEYVFDYGRSTASNSLP